MQWLIEIGVGLVVIPWIAWVTSSIFSQRQELALLKNSYGLNKELFDLLQKKLR